MSIPVEEFSVVISVAYQFGTNAAFLLLCALGLIVILGMMNIINLAHGELMMMGAYTASLSYQAGLPFPLCVAVSFLRRRLRGRRVRAPGRTPVLWSGTERPGGHLGDQPAVESGHPDGVWPVSSLHPHPGGSLDVGAFSLSVYWLILIAVSIAVVVALAWLYNRTTFGLHARATMQDAAMARALGVNTGRIYMLTFSLGAGLAGFSGALLAPTASIMPFMGQQFVAPAFITVVVGGAANVIAGAVGSSVLLSLVRTPVGFYLGAFLGLVALLLAALIIIRLMPNGVSAALVRWSDRRAQSH